MTIYCNPNGEEISNPRIVRGSLIKSILRYKSDLPIEFNKFALIAPNGTIILDNASH